MRVLKIFILGLVYGWFLKLAIDRFYRKQELEAIRLENASLKEYVATLETRLQTTSGEPKSARRPAPASASARAAGRKDDLKVIKGIGPVIEKKLNNAGVRTFEALGKLTTDELENILGNIRRLVQSEAEMIAEAQQLAQREGPG
jgi:large subunit ribosomal protein L21